MERNVPLCDGTYYNEFLRTRDTDPGIEFAERPLDLLLVFYRNLSYVYRSTFDGTVRFVAIETESLSEELT
ncbi:hypothetical protein [Haladaptatus sp. NG-WS-4]